VLDCKPQDGFASALFRLSDNNEQRLEIKSIKSRRLDHPSPLAGDPVNLNLPNETFIKSLEAQLFHIKAGIVGNETRPGDPGNYDVNWLRDGAYVLVALARSGEHQLVKQLSSVFASQDFFGGFGSEADAPGLAIWVLDEVSSRLHDPQYDKSIWPDVERKVKIITEMLEARDPVIKAFSGPIVPTLYNMPYRELALVADPTKEGLIVGKMDNHRPVFYVNGTAYLGLERAASIADRLGLSRQAEEYRQRSREVRAAWQKAIDEHVDKENQRTIASALWPTGVAVGSEASLVKLLEESWSKRRDDSGSFLSLPMWTYFDIAEAHQWLLLGNPKRYGALWNGFGPIRRRLVFILGGKGSARKTLLVFGRQFAAG
jgi:hypothetical protein